MATEYKQQKIAVFLAVFLFVGYANVVGKTMFKPAGYDSPKQEIDKIEENLKDMNLHHQKRYKRDVPCKCLEQPLPSNRSEIDDPAFVQLIVDQHNAEREADARRCEDLESKKQCISNMNKIVWDSTLADLAQGLANTCVFEHPRLTDCNYNPPLNLGQNLYIKGPGYRGYPSVFSAKFVDAWAQEREDFNYTSEQCKTDNKCGHWLQVSQAGVTKVGCGYKHCPEIKAGGNTLMKRATYVVCNYDVGVSSGFPGIVGQPCNSCETCENSLCVPVEPKNVCNSMKDIVHGLCSNSQFWPSCCPGQPHNKLMWKYCTKTCCDHTRQEKNIT